jgi:leucyl aminopeptidase
MNSNAFRLTTSSAPAKRLDVDTLAVFIPQDPALRGAALQEIQRSLGIDARQLVALGDLTGKASEVAVLYPDRSRTPRRILLVGLGEKKKWSLETYRKAAAAAAKKARALKSGSLALWMPSSVRPSADAALAFAEGAWLALYRFDRYITKKPDDPPPLRHLHLASDVAGWRRVLPAAAERATIICEATCFARDLANAPGSEIYPETLAEAAQESGERAGYSVTVLTESEIRQHNMGGVLGVSQGSARPPRFLILEYGDQKLPPVVLVGKGVCFDSGGISIKPAAGMAEMKMDMSGAAAVIGTFEAVARLELPVHVVGLIPAVENMPGGRAIKPGDIIRHYNGKTSEVDNTDAEGRLILADALGFAETFKPKAVIDLATLTGAVVVALGHMATGMLGNDEGLKDGLRAAGLKTYERVWELPMFDEYERLIKSDVADVKNVGGRWAGAITGAWFLRKFIGDYSWVHLDIAGTAMVEEPGDYIPKGGSGVGVRLLTEFLSASR